MSSAVLRLRKSHDNYLNNVLCLIVVRAVEWTSPMGRVVDSLAEYRYTPNVQDCLHVPRPPTYKPAKQGPGKDLSEVIGSHQRPDERLADVRRSFR